MWCIGVPNKKEFFFQKWMANFHISHFCVSSKFQFDFETAQWSKKKLKKVFLRVQRNLMGKNCEKNYKFQNETNDLYQLEGCVRNMKTNAKIYLWATKATNKNSIANWAP